MKKDFFIKLIPYIIIGVYGVIIDVSMSSFFYNQIFMENIDKLTFLTFSEYKFATYLFAPISALIGGVAGLINNFLMNEYFVYKQKADYMSIAKRFLKYITAVLFGTFFIGKLIVLTISLSVLHLPFTVSNLLAILVGTFINYPINYFWTWGDKKDKDPINQILQTPPLDI